MLLWENINCIFCLSAWLGYGLGSLCKPIWGKDLSLLPKSEEKRGNCHHDHPGEKDQTGHSWWSSHQLQTCMPLSNISFQKWHLKQIMWPLTVRPTRWIFLVQIHSRSFKFKWQTLPAQQSKTCSYLCSPAEHPGTSLHPLWPSHTALSSHCPPARKKATWPPPPGSRSVPWPLSDCRAPHSAALLAARCPGSGSCTSPVSRILSPGEINVTEQISPMEKKRNDLQPAILSHCLGWHRCDNGLWGWAPCRTKTKQSLFLFTPVPAI